MYHMPHTGYGSPGTSSLIVEAGNTSTAVGLQNAPEAYYAPEAPAPPVVPVAIEAGGATDGEIVDEHGGGANGDFAVGLPTWIEDGQIGTYYQQGRSWLGERTDLPVVGPVPNWSLLLGAIMGGYLLLK